VHTLRANTLLWPIGRARARSLPAEKQKASSESQIAEVADYRFDVICPFFASTLRVCGYWARLTHRNGHLRPKDSACPSRHPSY